MNARRRTGVVKGKLFIRQFTPKLLICITGISWAREFLKHFEFTLVKCGSVSFSMKIGIFLRGRPARKGINKLPETLLMYVKYRHVFALQIRLTVFPIGSIAARFAEPCCRKIVVLRGFLLCTQLLRDSRKVRKCGCGNADWRSD